MKIAIQGHPFKGKEVIEILKSLGGKSIFTGLGFDEKYYYYINPNGMIRESLITIKTKDEFKLYTLEEFEKEFPFKIGDEVMFPITKGWLSGKITGIKDFEYEVDTRTGGYRYVEPHKLSLYPMKEERNITLTLDKAKEWYKKGGELKEIALQAFSEKELNPLPRSWEEFCRQGNPIASWRYNIPIKYEALYKLEQLRDCWRQGWVPDYTKTYKKYRIKKLGTEYIVDWSTGLSDFLVFQTEEMAKEFLECFRDLIEQAGDLI